MDYTQLLRERIRSHIYNDIGILREMGGSLPDVEMMRRQAQIAAYNQVLIDMLELEAICRKWDEVCPTIRV